MSCHLGKYDIVERLLDSRNTFQFSVDVNVISEDSYGQTALHFACSNKDCPLLVRKLLQHPNIDVNMVGAIQGYTS